MDEIMVSIKKYCIFEQDLWLSPLYKVQTHTFC